MFTFDVRSAPEKLHSAAREVNNESKQRVGVCYIHERMYGSRSEYRESRWISFQGFRATEITLDLKAQKSFSIIFEP